MPPRRPSPQAPLAVKLSFPGMGDSPRPLCSTPLGPESISHRAGKSRSKATIKTGRLSRKLCDLWGFCAGSVRGVLEPPVQDGREFSFRGDGKYLSAFLARQKQVGSCMSRDSREVSVVAWKER